MVSLRGGWVGGKGSGKPSKRTERGQGELSGDGLLCAEAGNSCTVGRGYSLRRETGLQDSDLQTTAVGIRSRKDDLRRDSGGEEEHLASKNFRTWVFSPLSRQ